MRWMDFLFIDLVDLMKYFFSHLDIIIIKEPHVLNYKFITIWQGLDTLPNLVERKFQERQICW